MYNGKLAPIIFMIKTSIYSRSYLGKNIHCINNGYHRYLHHLENVPDFSTINEDFCRIAPICVLIYVLS